MTYPYKREINISSWRGAAEVFSVKVVFESESFYGNTFLENFERKYGSEMYAELSNCIEYILLDDPEEKHQEQDCMKIEVNCSRQGVKSMTMKQHCYKTYSCLEAYKSKHDFDMSMELLKALSYVILRGPEQEEGEEEEEEGEEEEEEVELQQPGPPCHECPICLDTIRDDDLLLGLDKCDHVFHTICICEWLKKRKSCPKCRTVPTDLYVSKWPAVEEKDD